MSAAMACCVPIFYTPCAILLRHWGGYSDYYGFGTEEFLGLCRKLNAEPLVVLPASSTESEQVQYAIDWVHYLNDLPTT